IHVMYADGLGNQRLGLLPIDASDSTLRRYSIKFKANRTGNVNILFARTVKALGEGFRIKKIKVEKGSIQSDWTPAPEDMATVIKTNEIERTADYSKTAITNLSKNGVVESSSVNATKDGITERVAKVDANGNISYSNRDVKLNSIVTSVADDSYISRQIQTSSLIQDRKS